MSRKPFSPPTITDARGVCDRRGLRGVLVVGFLPDGTVGVVTYGDTRRECAALAKVNDRIFELIMDGTIPVDECLTGGGGG